MKIFNCNHIMNGPRAMYILVLVAIFCSKPTLSFAQYYFHKDFPFAYDTGRSEDKIESTIFQFDRCYTFTIDISRNIYFDKIRAFYENYYTDRQEEQNETEKTFKKNPKVTITLEAKIYKDGSGPSIPVFFEGNYFHEENQNNYVDCWRPINKVIWWETDPTKYLNEQNKFFDYQGMSDNTERYFSIEIPGNITFPNNKIYIFFSFTSDEEPVDKDGSPWKFSPDPFELVLDDSPPIPEVNILYEMMQSKRDQSVGTEDIPYINYGDEIGRNALHYAVQLNKKTALHSLLKNQGLDPNIGDAFGYTSLHYAVMYNRGDMIDILLEYCADTEQKNAYHASSKQIASELGYNTIANKLKFSEYNND
ncbi:MAG: ankyrin repeat domain-containing protein [Deltaproteobacteria bacterium]|nr:ankyrin repeat domain-containing protein [Deltaproteobacteria bacterium]